MMNNGNMRLALDIRPLDTLFFRDARPFEPAGQARSVLPLPQTLAGAIRTLLLESHGVDWNRLADGIRQHGSFASGLAAMGSHLAAVAAVEVRGPWITRNGDILVPIPASLRQEKGREADHLVRLDPLRTPPPGWLPEEDGMLPLWRHGRATLEAVKSFIQLDGLGAFLRGDVPEASQLVCPEKLYAMDTRVGIGIDVVRGAAGRGLIYSASLLVLGPGVAFYAEVEGPKSALEPLAGGKSLMRFGGEGRCVEVRRSTKRADWPEVRPEPGRGRLVLLTAPAWFNGWKPAALSPVSAAVGKYVPVSGWDMARGGPKPNRFMVPAGSVYFLPAGARVPAHLGRHEDNQVGWGHYLEGNWNYV